MVAVDPRSTSTRPERFPCFDGLRGIAAGGVLLLHVGFISGYTNATQHSVGPYLARGEAGVYLFFVISGYLLYRPFVADRLDRKRLLDVRAYARRRILRIVPAYWVALTILAVVLDTRMRHDFHGIGDVVVYYGFLQIYFTHTYLGGLQQAWTLCTEMSFYVFLPVWAVLMRATGTRRGEAADDPGHERRVLRTEVIGLAVLFAIGLVSRFLVVRTFPDEIVAVDNRLDWLLTNIDVFAVGMAVAVAREWSVRRPQPVAVVEWCGRHPGASWALAALTYWLVCTKVGLTLGIGADGTRQWMLRQVLYTATALFLLLPAVFGPQHEGVIRRILRSKVMVVAGLLSYGIYLWHEGIIDLWMQARDIAPFHGSFATMLPAVLCLTVAVAAASYVLVEKPALALKTARGGRSANPGAPQHPHYARADGDGPADTRRA